ncbi:MAG: butyryl-CoA:acetate CoA-transferase [Clostridiales bacterium]|nr:butyryl-CoA:acetate CoA-transferase [Clostridiales bacterium]
MDYLRDYQSKLTSASEAVKCVRSGDWVDYGWCTGTCYELDIALAARMPELTDVKIRGGVLIRRPAIFDVPDAPAHFCWNSWHMTGIERKAIDEGIAYYIPLRYSELPRHYRESVPPVDVAMLQVTPMDAQGNFNFGPNSSHQIEVLRRAKTILVEVNENMPYCYGVNNSIHVSQVTKIIEGSNPAIATLPAAKVTQTDEQISANILPLIPNGATLQLGIGGLPNTIGGMIAASDLQDLGVQTEMYVDAYLAIAKAGKITGQYKGVDRGIQTYAFAAGTQELYDYMNRNKELFACQVSYTNDASVVAQTDNFISINSAVDLDLFGQINAESSGMRHISGAGGQQDFVLGAYLSKGGKSIIACPATFKKKDGTLASRIRPTLAEGSIVTDTRTNTHWVATEYGVANLKGLSSWERAEALIGLAAPQFRDELIAEAEKLHIWRKSNRR